MKVIDTNILLHNPNILEEIEDAVITIRVIEEIDGLKKNINPEVAYQARRASYAILSNDNKITYCEERNNKLSVDDELVWLCKKHKWELISNDLNLQIKCRFKKVKCSGYSKVKENYTGVGSLTAITIANKTGGTSLISTGKLNLTNGQITKGASKEPVTKATNLPQTIGTWNESTFPKMLVIPTAATAAAGDIVFSFTIDGQVYNWNVPVGTAWEQGKKNTYTVTIKGTALEVSPVSITAWGAGKTDSGTIQ